MANWNTNDYIDVQERINRFWSEYPTGSIVTTLMSMPDNFDACRYEAKVYQFRTDAIPSAVGYAQEFRLTEGRGVNVTSHEENCETSAIGRALANMGYATKLSERPSRQEMDKVERTLAADHLPARTRTTTVNTIPDEPDDLPAAPGIVDWTVFWDRAKRMGLPVGVKEIEAKLGTSLGNSPELAMEKVLAWAKDNGVQAVLA